MEESPPHSLLCLRQGRSGSARALKLVVKKQPASVEHGLHFPGKTWGSVKKKLPLDSAHTNSKIEKVEVA